MSVPLPTAGDVAAFLDWPADEAARIEPHLSSVVAHTRAYTRGVGFLATEDGERCEPEVAAVILSATARSASNPAQAIREEAGTYSTVAGRFDGYTLIERHSLHRHRRRTA